MVARPDAGPGCLWMKTLHNRVLGGPADPQEKPHPMLRWFWSWFFILVFGVMALVRPWSSANFSPKANYESETRIAGLPLIAVGAQANGVIAIGGRATGIIAIGGIAIGVFAIGGVAIGGFALAGLSAGFFALGGGAVGWWALGGGAAGRYAFGGVAVGDYAYAGNGIAIGYHEANGRQKEKLLGNATYSGDRHP